VTVRTAEVAIIGGGVIGTSIAYQLTVVGVTDVTLLERGPLASGVTGVCPGGIRQQFEGEADCRMAQHSVRFYERINEILRPDDPFDFERSGYLFLAQSEPVLRAFRQNVAMQNRLGIPSQILSAADIHDRLPSLSMEGILGGSFCAEDGFIEDCHGITHLFAARARQAGARIVREEVHGIAPIGRHWRVTTDAGELHAAHVVLAAGCDTVQLAAQAGISLPITPERRRLAYTTACAFGVLPPLVIAFERSVAAKQLRNGVLYLGWLGESPDVDDLTFMERTMEAGATLLPLLSELPVRRVMSGLYDNTPDRRPLLGAVPGIDGLFLAVGFSGHGFMIAPAVGEALAATITATTTDLPIRDFSLERFFSAASREGLQI
jgi:sarcosine oxidase subunit beta